MGEREKPGVTRWNINNIYLGINNTNHMNQEYISMFVLSLHDICRSGFPRTSRSRITV